MAMGDSSPYDDLLERMRRLEHQVEVLLSTVEMLRISMSYQHGGESRRGDNLWLDTTETRL